MIILAAYAALAAGIILAALAVAASGAPLIVPPVLAPPIAIERPAEPPVAVLAPIRCLPSPVWCEASRRWRDPVTKRYAAKPQI